MEKEKKTVEEILRNENLSILKTIHYDSIIGFVFDNIKKRSIPSFFYHSLNLITLITLIVVSIFLFSNDDLTFRIFIKYFFSGLVAGSVIVIPFHELFHALAYKIVGAPKILFGMDLKQMIFYVAADRFITGKMQFIIVALAPFVILNLLVIIWLFNFPSAGNIILGITFMLFHNIMCIGDFAMLAYFYRNRKKELYTFDIPEDRQSFICERIKSQ